MFGKKGSKILKLPPVRNYFTLAMTNKLVVINNSLRVPKIKKVVLYEMKFLVPNYSCLQNPLLGGYRTKIPVLSVLCPQLNLLNPPHPPKQNFWIRHWQAVLITRQSELQRSVALSVIEAEPIAASEVAKELLWLKRLFGELGGKGSEVPTLFVDNASAGKIAKNGGV